VTLADLLVLFWDIHDPTKRNCQFGDVGCQYRSGIYFESDQQKILIFESRQNLQYSKYFRGDRIIPIVTEVLKAKPFFNAEEVHQRYLEKGGQSSAKGNLTTIKCYG
jgi:methionine-S-sulfoxide reductase